MDNISPIRDGVVGKTVNNLDSRVNWENPSIFMPNTEDSKIDQKFIFKTLYEDI